MFPPAQPDFQKMGGQSGDESVQLGDNCRHGRVRRLGAGSLAINETTLPLQERHRLTMWAFEGST